MNGVEESQLVVDEISEIQRKKAIERRRAIAKRKAAERRRRKKRMRLLILAVCALIVVACAIIISNAPMSYENDEELITANSTAVKKQSGEFPEENPIQERKELFDKIEYYKAENAERYDEYFKANPDMPVTDIVWRVNANLDKPMYEFDIPVSGYDNPLMIVNKYYKVSEDYKPSDLADYGDGNLLRKEAGDAYLEMKEAAEKEGFYISIVSGYRSVEYQSGLYNRYLSSDSKENVDRYSARPGYSEHHTGMAMDIFGTNCSELRDFENSPEYPWVRDNCYKYGFIIRYLKETEDITGYESEPWHLRYVGTEVSTDMKEKNIKSFEEYYAKYLD